MKILFFSPYFYPYTSGVTTYPQKIFTYLAHQHEVTVLTFRHDKKLPQKETYNGMTIIRMPYMFTISKGFISPQSWYYFFTEARRAQRIFLNIPNFEGLPLAIIGRLCSKKIYSIFHCLVTLRAGLFNSIITFFLNSSIYMQVLLSDKIIGYTEDYVSHSWIGRLFKQKIITTLPPIQRLEVDNLFLAKLMKMKGQDIWVGYAGRTSREKGLTYLIESVRLLKDTLNPTLVFAGPYGAQVTGEEPYYDEVISVLKKKQMKYHFFGCLSGGELGAFYQSIDVLTLPSINSTEAFGMVQAESMLAGTPVITTNLPGVRQPVKMTGMGRVVPIANSGKLAEAIQEVIQHKDQYTHPDQIAHAHTIFEVGKTFAFYDRLIHH